MVLAGIHPFSIHLPPRAPSPNKRIFLLYPAATLADGKPDVPALLIFTLISNPS